MEGLILPKFLANLPFSLKIAGKLLKTVRLNRLGLENGESCIRSSGRAA